MTLRTPKPSHRSQLLLGFIAVFAVMTAALIGASQLSGGTARAEQTLTLHQPNSVHPGDAAVGTCPTPPAGQEDWYGWHFVAPSNENFTALTVTFQTAGEVSADPFPGAFVSHPDASHAYVWTETADTLVSGTATIEGTAQQDFFNLSSTCAPADTGEEDPGQITIVKQGLLAGATANFTHDINSGGSFTATIDDTTEVFTDVAPGHYEVTEAPLEGYTLLTVGCAVDGAAESRITAQDVEGDTLGIDLEAGQSLTCTFVNGVAQTAQFDVTINKYIDGAAAMEGDFSLTATWTAANLNGGAETSAGFNLNSGNGWEAVTSPMDAGADYSVVENLDGTCDPEDDYRLAGYGIGATAAEAADAPLVDTAAITDLQSDMYIAVFNEACDDSDTSQVTIVKQGLLGEDVASFTHDFDTDGTFDLSAADNSVTFTDVAAGHYEVTELPLEGYTLTGAGCAIEAGRSQATAEEVENNTLGIDVVAGQNLICTFVNGAAQEIQYDVTVTKYIGDALATEGDFALTSTWTAENLNDGMETSGDFNLNEANSWQAVTSPMNEGSSYSVVENLDGVCEAGDDFRLAGYGVGTTLEEAAAMEPGPEASIEDLTSDMFIVVFNEECANGSITIVKEGLEGDVEATFTHDLPDQDASEFTLSASDNSETFEGIPAGTYHFTELELEGWQLVSQGCEFAPAPFALGEEGTLEVILEEDQDLVCTFVNERDDLSVTTTKYIDGALATEGTFEFSQSVDGGTATTFSLMEPDWMATSEDIAFGSSFSLSETGIDATCEGDDVYRLAGYTTGETLEDALAAEDSDSVEIASLESDMNIVVWNETCAGLGSITIVKDFEPDAADVSANFTTEGEGLEDFSIMEGPGRTFENLGAADYTFTEGAIPGWRIQSIFCSGQSSPSDISVNLGGAELTVSLPAGDDITCTFTNVPDEDAGEGSITIVKAWEDEAGAPVTGVDTVFDSSANLGAAGNTFTLTEGDAEITFDSLSADTYLFTEEALEGWTLTEIFCGPGILDIDIDLAAGTLGVNLAEDQQITCTFTNTQSDVAPEGGSLTITKVWEGGDAAPVTFTTSDSLNDDDDMFVLDDPTDEMLFAGLENAVELVVTETIPDGWSVSNIVCTGQTNSLFDTDFPTGVLSVTLADDEDLVCTFTNTADVAPTGGSISITKSWGTDTPVTTAFAGDGGIGAFDLDGADATDTFDGLAAGQYVITESDLAGWTLDSIVCTPVGSSTSAVDTVAGTATIQLAADDDVSCTFTNSLDDTTPTGGSLTITKSWLNGAAGTATFTASDSLNDPDDTFVLDGTTTSQVFPNLANAGVYTVTETVPTGWTATVACTGNTTSTIDTTVANAVSVTLADDDDVVCTFTNTAAAGLLPDFAVDSSVPDVTNTNVPSANLPSSNVPSSNIPSANVPPADNNAVSNTPAPSSNIPSVQLPSAVSNEFPVSNIAGESAPLPPSAGNSQSDGNTSIALLAGLAIMAGALAAVGYGLRRR